MFEELYEDCLSYLKIRRLFKAFSIKSDYRVSRNIIVTECVNWIFFGFLSYKEYHKQIAMHFTVRCSLMFPCKQTVT